MLNSLPASARILENRQVDALLLEITIAPLWRSWHQDELEICLGLISAATR